MSGTSGATLIPGAPGEDARTRGAEERPAFDPRGWLRYQELFDFAPNGYLVTDPHGVIKEANHVAAAMCGTPKAFLVDKPLLFYVAEGQRRTFTRNLYSLLTWTPDRRQWEMTLHPPRLPAIQVLVSASAVRAESGRTDLQWVLQDITRRQQAEEALEAENRFADNLIDLADVVILVLDQAGIIRRANRFASALTSHHSVELLGLAVSELVVPEEKQAFRQEFAPVLSQAATCRGLHHVRAGRGEIRALAWTARPVAGAGDDVWVLFVGNDVTDLVDAQQRAVQAERLAAVGQMVASLGHECRNALQRSCASLAVLDLRLQDRPEDLLMVERVERAQRDLQRLFDEVREYAAPIRMDTQTCDMSQIWREAWDDLAAARVGRDAKLSEDIQVADLHCEGSPFHLKQVFRNLLDNALSVGTDAARITIRYSDGKCNGRDALEIAVEDNGPGFAPEQRQKAFEPFFTTRAGGTGLGLPICRRLIEAHGGQIAVADRDGPGATIVTAIPRHAE